MFKIYTIKKNQNVYLYSERTEKATNHFFGVLNISNGPTYIEFHET